MIGGLPRLSAYTTPDSRAETALDWMKDALCTQVDPDLFFPEVGGNVKSVLKICEDCPVRSQCLQVALDNDERFGIWGGLSPRQRRKLKDPTAKGSWSHGTMRGWSQGCTDREGCPGGENGLTCHQARLVYQAKWEARRRANGGLPRGSGR